MRFHPSLLVRSCHGPRGIAGAVFASIFCLCLLSGECRAAKVNRKLRADIQERIDHPDYRHHIIAVDEFGSALCPVFTPRNDGKPGAAKVIFKEWKTEDTRRNEPDWQKTFRKEYIQYLEARAGELDCYGDRHKEDGLFANYAALRKAGAVDRVVIHIHGGLNFIGSAAVKATELTHAMLEDRAYPIFIVWNSNLFGTYREHLFHVREGIRDDKFALLTSPLQLVGDIGSAASRFPLALTKLFRNDGYQLNPSSFHRYNQARIRFDALKMGCTEPAEGTEISVSEGAYVKTFGGKVEDSLSWGVSAPLRIATIPLIDTLGGAAWHNMVRRTRVMFERESSFVNLELLQKCGQQRVWKCGRESDEPDTLQLQRNLRSFSREGALRWFFTRAQGELALYDGFDPSITLIGHSMGAIVAGEALARFPGMPFENVVFMAAASSVNDFKLKVSPYLQSHPKTRFYNLCLHSYRDAGERPPFNSPEIAPRGSLLAWIDSLFESPTAEDDRTMGRWENAMIAMDWLPDNAPGRTTIKAFGSGRLSDVDGVPFPYEDRPAPGAKKLAEPTHHGDFGQFGAGKSPSYRFWNPYYWTAEPIKGVTRGTRKLPPVKTAAAKPANKPGFLGRVFGRAPKEKMDSAAPARSARHPAPKVRFARS